ncbi:MAG TPA: diguanylate cyclase [Bryobacteraceae bacterium]|nr:diguanylate cyclase [Bryobacteraceae bacterium]
MLPDLQLAIAAERIRDAEHPMKVLAAEDNPVFQTLLSNMLTKWGYHAVIARDGNEAWEALQQPDGPQLAILDWMMPGLNGVDICRGLRASGREPYVYILLLTARANAQDLVEGMEAGADDYLTKPFQAHELRVRLRAGRRILELQQQLVAAREALRDQATHDSLTGLLNRGAILATLGREIARTSREDQALSVLMVDLDRFKQVNDTYGHAAGDEVLRESARRMRETARKYDGVGRYGGEEFVIVLPGCDADSAWAQAERVRQTLAGSPFSSGQSTLNVTCSIGVSTRLAGGWSDADTMLREADLALYRAKGEGRNRVIPAVETGPLYTFSEQH